MVDGVVGLIALLIVFMLLHEFLGSSWAVAPRAGPTASKLEEHLAEYPPPRPGTGDRRPAGRGGAVPFASGGTSWGRHRQRDRRGRNPGDSGQAGDRPGRHLQGRQAAHAHLAGADQLQGLCHALPPQHDHSGGSRRADAVDHRRWPGQAEQAAAHAGHGHGGGEADDGGPADIRQP